MVWTMVGEEARAAFNRLYGFFLLSFLIGGNFLVGRQSSCGALLLWRVRV